MTFRFLMASIAILSFLAPTASARAEDLIVSADASLADVFRIIGEDFHTAEPSIDVTFNFASAEDYLAQLRNGQVPDMLASASPREVSALVRQGGLDGSTRVEFASNRLVMIAPLKGGPADFAGVASDSVRKVAIGDPKTVPGGAYTRQSLEQMKLWDAVAPKIVLGQSVRQVLQFVEAGSADAAFVFMSDARSSKGVRVVAAIPDSTHAPIIYVLATFSGSAHRDAARKFAEYVAGPDGQGVLFEYGFGKVPEPTPARP
jgi:molybdate transport system substrate-binding protein